MSHFTVVVRVPEALVTELGVEKALAKMLAPYQENNLGDCPEEFLEFHEDRDCEPDKKTGRRGYWENPNKRWDWYLIGGRWSGFFPLLDPNTATVGEPGAFDNKPEPGRGDVCRIGEIDTDAMAKEAREKFEAWWVAFEAYREDPTVRQDPFDGPRHKALHLGLVIVRRGPPEPGEEDRAHRWGDGIHNVDDGRRDWHDVISNITKEEAERFLPSFCPSTPYATLDSAGWHAPGEMGWWGVSSETPDAALAHDTGYLDWLRATPSGDVLVAVDCHI